MSQRRATTLEDANEPGRMREPPRTWYPLGTNHGSSSHSGTRSLSEGSSSEVGGEIMHSKDLSAKKGEDRISNLPCNLISHILSFLPTKNAVATCVLSTKWKQSWTSYDSVDFDDTLLLNPQKSDSFFRFEQKNSDRSRTHRYQQKNSDRAQSLKKSFTSFMDQVMLLHRVPRLSKFHLKCGQSSTVKQERLSKFHGYAWIGAALMSSVQELHLFIPMESSKVLPRDLFSCGTLVVLKLGGNFVMKVPASVHIPNLKILHLECVKILDDDSIDRLNCGCPVLDELNMYQCVGEDVRVVKISAPVLTRLVMTNLHPYKIVLETPALLFLEISDHLAAGYSFQSLCHLVEAWIQIFAKADDSLQFDELLLDSSEALSDLLEGLSNLQRLFLRGKFIEVMYNTNGQIPKFHCMTYLELGELSTEVWELLPKLLGNSPQLEALVFEDVTGAVFSGRRYVPVPWLPELGWKWNPPQSVPSCLLFHLKEIEFKHFKWLNEEMDFLDYFLDNAEVLEKVKIGGYSSGRRSWTIHMTQEKN